MKYEILPEISRKKLTAALFTAIIALSFVGAFSYIAIPFAAAFFAALLLTEKNKIKPFSIIASIAALLIDILLNKATATSSIQFIIAGIFIMLSVLYGYRKSSLSAILTVVFIGFFMINLYTVAALDTGDYSLDSVAGYYLNIYNSFEQMAVEYLIKLPINSQSSAPQYLTSEMAEAIVSSLIEHIISFIVILSFALSGIAIKCFTAFSVRIVTDDREIRRWRFTTGNLFAYAYAALAFINLFLSGSGVGAVAISNLYLILMIPYAYIGAKFLIGYIKFSDKRFMVLSAFIIGVIILGFNVLLPISLFGTYAVIVTNKYSQTNENKN